MAEYSQGLPFYFFLPTHSDVWVLPAHPSGRVEGPRGRIRIKLHAKISNVSALLKGMICQMWMSSIAGIERHDELMWFAPSCLMYKILFYFREIEIVSLLDCRGLRH